MWGAGIPALEVNDNFLSSAIVTSELLPPIPTTWHTYHLQGRGKEHSSSKEIPQISSVEANLRDERLLKENTAGKAGKHHKHITNMLVEPECMNTCGEYLLCIKSIKILRT